MKDLFFIFFSMIVLNKTYAQLYINGALTIQNGITVYVDDTAKLASLATLTVNGILQSTKGVNTNQNSINTGTTGSIISPIPSGVTKTYDIGTNNKVTILHTSAGSINYQIALRDNVYINPQNNASVITTNAVNKTWIVQPLSNSTNNTIGLFWNATDELSGFIRSVSGMSKWQSGVTSAWAFVNGTSAATLTGSTPAYAKTVLVGNMNTGTYYFSVGGNGSSLPVHLVSFDAIKTNEDVLLNWETTSEINSSHFELERSEDGQIYKTIQNQKAAGNSNTKITYHFIDNTPFKIIQVSKLYYRLKAVDLDGTFIYSIIKSLDNNDMDNSFVIYPNPTSGTVFISSIQTIGIIKVFDVRGKLVYSQQNNGKQTNTELDLSALSNGVYLIQAQTENGNISNNKVVISK